MKTFNIKFREVLVAVEEIEADTLEEALEKASDMYNNSEIIVMPENITTSEQLSDSIPYLEELSNEALNYLNKSIGKFIGKETLFNDRAAQWVSDEEVLLVSSYLGESADKLQLLFETYNPDSDSDIPTDLLNQTSRFNVLKYLMYGK